MSNTKEFVNLVDLMGLQEKDNYVICQVVSVTNGVVNNQTITVEGASDEKELVFKVFEHYRGILEASKDMAALGGFPTDAESFAKDLAKGKPGA